MHTTQKKSRLNQKGSLALEQVLFIGAVVTMSLGLFAFYEKLSSYFSNVNVSSLPTDVKVPAGASNGTQNQ